MAAILQWLVDHQAHIWLIVALCINIARRIRTDEQLVAAAAKTKLGAAALAGLRLLGLDPVGAVQVIAVAVNTKAAAEASKAAVQIPDLVPPTLRPGSPQISPPGGGEGGIGGVGDQDPRGHGGTP